MSLHIPSYLKPPRTVIWLGVLTAVAGVAVVLSWPPTVPIVKPQLHTASAPPDAAAPARTAVPAPVPAPIAPSFDIVRVGPTGNAVFAGRGEPGAAIMVLESGKLVGTANADASGSWLLIPDKPLPSGAIEITLLSQSKTGVAVQGQAPLLMVVPGANAPTPAAPLAVLTPRNGPSRLVLAPEGTKPGKLGLDTVDYDDTGAIRFSGTALPHAPVRVYVDATPVGDATGDESGHWTLSPSQPVEPGVHKLRLDQLAADGKVARRVELPFLRETLAQSQVAPGSVVVQPRQNLWRLARRVYGAGIRYTVIYQANQDQIRDPRLIYAGQVFTIPMAPPAP